MFMNQMQRFRMGDLGKSNLSIGVDYKLSVNQQCEMAAKKASVIFRSYQQMDRFQVKS